jgi:hypothetical protein
MIKLYYRMLQSGYLGEAAANRRVVLQRILITPLPQISFIEIWRVLIIPILAQLLTLLLLPQIMASGIIQLTRYQPSMLSIVPVPSRALTSYISSLNMTTLISRTPSTNDASLSLVPNTSIEEVLLGATAAHEATSSLTSVEEHVMTLSDLSSTISSASSVTNKDEDSAYIATLETIAHQNGINATSTPYYYNRIGNDHNSTSTNSSNSGSSNSIASIPFVWIGPQPIRLEEFLLIRYAWLMVAILMITVWLISISFICYQRLQRTAFEDRYLVGRQLINFPVAATTQPPSPPPTDTITAADTSASPIPPPAIPPPIAPAPALAPIINNNNDNNAIAEAVAVA